MCIYIYIYIKSAVCVLCMRETRLEGHWRPGASWRHFYLCQNTSNTSALNNSAAPVPTRRQRPEVRTVSSRLVPSH